MTWTKRTGQEMLSVTEMTQAAIDFADTYNVHRDAVIVTPWGYPPLCLPPVPDEHGNKKLHAGSDLQLCTHPVFWLDTDTRRPLPGEPVWEWAIRAFLELKARLLVNEVGEWVDALSGVMDLNKPENQERLRQFRDGKFDPVLSRHVVERTPELHIDEARLAARQLYAAHMAQFRHFETVERDEARLRVDAGRTWLKHAPQYFQYRLDEWDQTASSLFNTARAGGIVTPEFRAARKAFSDSVDLVGEVLAGVVDHTRRVEAAVSANTSEWSDHFDNAGAAIDANINLWEQVYDEIERSAAAVYADSTAAQPYSDMRACVQKWWDALWAAASAAIEQADALDADGRLYPRPEANDRELDILMGRERWRSVAPPPLPNSPEMN